MTTALLAVPASTHRPGVTSFGEDLAIGLVCLVIGAAFLHFDIRGFRVSEFRKIAGRRSTSAGAKARSSIFFAAGWFLVGVVVIGAGVAKWLSS